MLRSKLTYANVMATVAVFIALGGGAYAASQINGAKLKNRSVSGSKIRRDGLGGTEIKESRLGQVPRAARAADSSKLGGTPAGSYQRFDSTLPSGQTEAGEWAGFGTGVGPVGQAVNYRTPLSFQIDSAHKKFMGIGATSIQCPGPRRAAPGYLCLYLTQAVSADSPVIENAVTGTTPLEKTGFYIRLTGFGTGQAYAYGGWAVTAP